MPLIAYKLLHIFGIVMTFVALGGLAVAAAGGHAQGPVRRQIAFLHGVGLFLLLLGGFGMLAKIPDLGWPPWLMGKVAIWVLLGAGPFVLRRRPGLAAPLLAVFPLLGLLAAWLVLVRPG